MKVAGRIMDLIKSADIG